MTFLSDIQDSGVKLNTADVPEANELTVQIMAAGITSLGAIAAELNIRHIQTARGGKWHASSVRNLLARIQMAAVV